MEENEIKERILHKAGEMFLRFGFSRVTMEEIAVELGMSKKTIYRFFPGKEQLLKEMITNMRCKLEDYLQELWGNNEMSFLEKLKNLMNYIGNQSITLRGPLGQDLQKNFPQLWEEIIESRKTHSLQKFNLLINEGIEKGVFRKDIDQQIVLLMYMNAIQGILNPDVLSQLPYTANQVFESIIRVFLEGIFTEEGRNKYLSIKHEDNVFSTTTNINSQEQLMNFRVTKLIWIFILSGLISINGIAQDVKKLSVDESVQIGLENSHSLHSSKEKVKNTQARLSELKTNLLPSLKFSGVYTRLSPIEPVILSFPGLGNFDLTSNIVNNYSAKLTLQQPLFTGFKLLSSVDIADYNASAQKQDYTKDEHDLIFNIKNAYWNLYKANQLKTVVDENVNQIKAHLDDVNNMFNQGLSTKNDVLKVQVQLGDVQIKQIDANNNVRLSMINLDNVMGLPLSTQIEPLEKINSKVENINALDLYLDKAYQYRPELLGMDFRIKASESGVTLAKSGWWPQLYLVGNYLSARPNQRIFPTADKFNETRDVSLSVSWDLWNWGVTGHQTDQAQTQVEQSKDSYKIIKDNITLEVTQTYLNILQAKEKMTVADNNVSQAEENYRVTDEKFKNGLTLNSELLDAEVALLIAKTNFVQSQVDYELAKAQLEKSSDESSLK